MAPVEAQFAAILIAFLFVIATYARLCLSFARGLQGAHRVAGWKSGVSMLVAVVVTALLFGMVLPDAAYGWHPSAAMSFSHGDFGFGLSFGE